MSEWRNVGRTVSALEGFGIVVWKKGLMVGVMVGSMAVVKESVGACWSSVNVKIVGVGGVSLGVSVALIAVRAGATVGIADGGKVTRRDGLVLRVLLVARIVVTMTTTMIANTMEKQYLLLMINGCK